MAAEEPKNNMAAEDDRVAELAHFKGRLYEYGRELLAEKPNHYLLPDALDLALARQAGKRAYKPSKGQTDAACDEAIREAAQRARDDFRSDAGQHDNGTASAAGAVPAAQLPIINRYNRRLRELVEEGLQALKQRNRPHPLIFTRAGALARMKWIDGAAQIEMLDTDSLTLVLDQAADWVSDDGTKHRKVEPPERTVRALLKLPHYDLPSLRGIAHAPFFAGGARLVAASGYDQRSGVFLDPAGLAALDEIAEQPNGEHVRMAEIGRAHV